jgi:radical SAM superfamily enzyme YgiQ (UPF0313 family)
MSDRTFPRNAKVPAARRLSRPANVCLVRCPTVSNVGAVGQDAVPPLGLAYISAALKRAGHRVSAVDAVGEAVDQYSRIPWTSRTLAHGLVTPQILERIDADAEVIGIACMFSVEWLLVRELVEAIRQAFPRAHIVLGGEHATACPEYSLQDSSADICVLGEGEATIVELVDALLLGEDLHQVPGIAFRGPDGPVRTPPRSRIRPIDDIPDPDWDSFPIETYLHQHLNFGVDLGRSMPILASRGCPYQCTFCSSPQMWTTLWTARKPELVLGEIKHYMARYGAVNFDFYDLTAIVDKRWIRAFSQLLIDEDLKITWQLPSGTRSEAIDEEVCRLLYGSGCRVINYAPESGSPQELERIKKKVEPGRMLTSMRGAHRAGLQIKANFIFGLPGSTWGDVARTFGFIARVARIGVDDINAFPFSPYPGSELFTGLVASGRVRFTEEYFRSLLAYTDPEHSVSYCDLLGSRSLSVLCLVAMAYFYVMSCLCRPIRAIRFVGAVLGRASATKLGTALETRRRKRHALQLARDRAVLTVVLPARTRDAREPQSADAR